MKYRLYLFLFIVFATSCKQQSVVTDFLEDRQTGLQLYFYPSTLRMVNIEKNPDYDAMIKGVEQARFVRLDSGQFTGIEIAGLLTDLRQAGYEEVLSYRAKDQDITIMALEQSVPTFVALSQAGHECMLLEMQGMINVATIPGFLQTFNGNGFIDVLNLNDKNKKEK
ncbi:MAG: DUF4252 domain-containing protein [Cyclobacteriaceae bacterium]|nr:DUF4252 domain-containing protein [Cyclobacteriaceae bacterium]